MQLAIIGYPPASLVFITPAPVSLPGGTCHSATVQAQRALAPIAPALVASDTPVALTTTPTGGARFYSDSTCSTTTSFATIPAGASTATFWVKPLTGGPQTIAATASFGTASQTLTILPIVRRATCSFDAPTASDGGSFIFDLSTTCTFTPAVQDLNHALVFSQAIASANHDGASQARCFLSSNTTVTCYRSNGDSAAPVHVQVAEIPQGLQVRHFTAASCSAAARVNLSPAVDPSKTFVLKTLENVDPFKTPNMTTARLHPDGGQVELLGGSCSGYALQVAEWDGVKVTRFDPDGGLAPGSLDVTWTGFSAASNARVLLVQPQLKEIPGRTPSTCDFAVRGWLPSPSSLAVRRGGGTADGGCELSAVEPLVLERIDLGPHAVVQEQTVSLGMGQSTATVQLRPVDPTRTVVFAGTQLGAGQSTGELEAVSPVIDPQPTANTATAIFLLTSADTVTVTRASTNARATFTFYVVELDP
ncbi:MAG: hypothetical protein AB1730_11575 [Myxococcota bacterium]